MGLAENIKRVRKEQLGLTQRELADELGLEAMTISRWERGDVTPRPQHLRELARLAKKTIAWFYTENETVEEMTA